MVPDAEGRQLRTGGRMGVLLKEAQKPLPMVTLEVTVGGQKRGVFPFSLYIFT